MHPTTRPYKSEFSASSALPVHRPSQTRPPSSSVASAARDTDRTGHTGDREEGARTVVLHTLGPGAINPRQRTEASEWGRRVAGLLPASGSGQPRRDPGEVFRQFSLLDTPLNTAAAPAACATRALAFAVNVQVPAPPLRHRVITHLVPPWQRARETKASPLGKAAHCLQRAGLSLLAQGRRPSVEQQLHAIIDDACRQELNTEGLDAVLCACERAMEGTSPDQIRRAGWDDLVLGLIPDATGPASGPMAATVQLRVTQWRDETRGAQGLTQAAGPVR